MGRIVVVHDGAGGGGAGNGGVARVAQGHRELLVLFRQQVAEHRHGDAPRGLPRPDGQRPAGRPVVGARRGSAVSGGVGHGHGRASLHAQAHAEHRVDRAGVPLGHPRRGEGQLRLHRRRRSGAAAAGNRQGERESGAAEQEPGRDHGVLHR